MEKKIAENKAKQLNDEKFSKIFEKIDNEGSGLLDIQVMSLQLERFKDGMYKDVIQSGRSKIRILF